MRTMSPACAALLFAVVATTVCGADLQTYHANDKIPLFVDTVVPYHNPSESYRYYMLKFCRPQVIKYKSQSLGEVLQGSEKVYSPYEIRFRVNAKKTPLCTVKLEPDDINKFRSAILQQYYFTFYYDEIPIKGPVGEADSKTHTIALFNHYSFKLEYNGERVIEARVEMDKDHRVILPENPKEEIEVEFSYSVDWKETDVRFEDRTANRPKELYEEEIEIQWYSIINAFVLVVCLNGFLAYIVLRILKKDYQRYTMIDDPEEEADETGWKLLHGDVFRVPPYKSIFCAVLGTGVQLLLLFITMLTLAVVGVFYPYGRGTMTAAVIVLYSVTAVISGFVSGAFYRKLEGKDWVHTCFVTVALFPVPVFFIWAFLNTVAIWYDSTQALPFGTIVALFALYFLVTFPLSLGGSIMGKNMSGPLDPPCSTKQMPRPIPPVPRWRGPIFHVMLAGFLPFSSAYVELYYVFMSLWGHQLYTPYGILYLVFGILLMVVASITVAFTYLQLSMENWNWWWLSLVSGGSPAFFMYLYCFTFLWTESEMSGFMQLSYYFGYMAIICYGLFMVLGSVGFWCSFQFVLRIYESIKSD
eukprot:NODE_427_length_2095_cov_34.292278_g342_i0.p1 GENE.NODE_427_length_2095_cov_34.292278_g342_i0~~NODE_427_length_2095_cov_34.292278_g342_i0.p1  ORF type:complete len:585 (+),score=174.89 NODE_427_length_2095_cov_34.292278_g342_i0:191-1945(+)